MDEPFAALDAQTRDLMQVELLRIWQTAKKTVLFVTHQIEEAIYLSDRVMVMTKRPGRAKKIFKIDLPRPRDYEMRVTPEFNELKLRNLERAQGRDHGVADDGRRHPRDRASPSKHRKVLLGLLAVAMFLAAWQAVFLFVPFNPLFISKPNLIWAVRWSMLIVSGDLLRDLAVSAVPFVYGFSAAVVVGVALGIVMGWRARVGYALDPLMTIFYASPLVALAPLVIVFFGVGVSRQGDHHLPALGVSRSSSTPRPACARSTGC